MAESSESPIKIQQKPYELDDHWKLKQAFINQYKDEIPEQKLLCLAQLCVNVETLGVNYGKEVMEELARLSMNVPFIEEYRESKEKMSSMWSGKKKMLKKARHSQRQEKGYQGNQYRQNQYQNSYNNNRQYNQYGNQQQNSNYYNRNQNYNSNYGGNYNSYNNSNRNNSGNQRSSYGWQLNQGYGQYHQTPKFYQPDHQNSQYNRPRQGDYNRRYEVNNYQQQQLRSDYQSGSQYGAGYHQNRFTQPRDDSRMAHRLPYANQYRQNK